MLQSSDIYTEWYYKLCATKFQTSHNFGSFGEESEERQIYIYIYIIKCAKLGVLTNYLVVLTVWVEC